MAELLAFALALESDEPLQSALREEGLRIPLVIQEDVQVRHHVGVQQVGLVEQEHRMDLVATEVLHVGLDGEEHLEVGAEIPRDDIDYVTDLGLVTRDEAGDLTIANPIYRGVIPRAYG